MKEVEGVSREDTYLEAEEYVKELDGKVVVKTFGEVIEFDYKFEVIGDREAEEGYQSPIQIQYKTYHIKPEGNYWEFDSFTRNHHEPLDTLKAMDKVNEEITTIITHEEFIEKVKELQKSFIEKIK